MPTENPTKIPMRGVHARRAFSKGRGLPGPAPAGHPRQRPAAVFRLPKGADGEAGVTDFYDALNQAFEGSKPCTRCGNLLTEPGEALCPRCADPSLEAEMIVRLVTIRDEAKERIASGESPRIVAQDLRERTVFSPDAPEDEQIEQVREEVATQAVIRWLVGIPSLSPLDAFLHES